MTESHGLTTEDALVKLKQILENEVCLFQRHKTRWPYVLMKTFYPSELTPVSWIGIACVIVELAAIVINAASDQQERLASLCLEIFIIAVLTITVIGSSIREALLKSNEVERRILQVNQSFVLDDLFNASSYSDLPDLAIPECNSITLVWTYRDNKIVNLPWNLLVEGDIIILGPSRVAPAECRQVGSLSPKSFNTTSHVTLEAGDIYNPTEEEECTSCKPFPRQRFEIIQAPARKIIRSYLETSSKKNATISSKDVNLIVYIIESRVIWLFMFSSVAMNLLRWQLMPEAVGHYLEMLLQLPAYTILPLLPLTFPLLWILVTMYGTARLRTLFDLHTVKMDSAYCEVEEHVSLEHVDCVTAISSFCKIIAGDPLGLPRTVDLLHTLGSITTFCCIDKEGILCHTRASPEKVFFFKDQAKVKRTKEVINLLETDTNDFEDHEKELHATCEGKVGNDIEILSISPHSKSKHGIQFDDVDWDEEMPSLKPLGINILLNSSCLYPLKSIRDDDFIRHLSLAANSSAVPNFRGCMCSFAKEIGFQDRIINMYKNKQLIIAYRQVNTSTDLTRTDNVFVSLVKDKHVPCIISSVVNEGQNGVSQLLTQGSADLILDTCSEFWNGEEICELTHAEKLKALNFFQRMNITGKCVAFAYRPILEENMAFKDTLIEFTEQEIAENNIPDDVMDSHTPKKSILWMKKTQKDLKCEDLLTAMGHENQTACTKNICKQIFLGMVSFSHALKEDVINMVEQLDNAGIRFVHFSYENELLSRVFCQRLGLETGWNCHISLAEDNETTFVDEASSSVAESMPLLQDDENEAFRMVGRRGTDTSISLGKTDDYYPGQTEEAIEPYWLSNNSKLPKGIQRMRSHLEKVDDVPLLVPLFTDCSSPAISEMVKIMQEYGEIVCCVGSVLNSKNHEILTQSDISIALEPVIHQSCILKPPQLHSRKLTRERSVSESDVSMDAPKEGLLALSMSLNSITCSLTCQRTNVFPIAALLCEARRLTIGCQNCFLFLLSCQLSLSLLMLFASLALLPPPLTGIQLLWLICVIVPLLSLSLIGTPANSGLMKMITGKRKKNNLNKKEFVYPFVKQFIPTFGLNAVFVVIFVLPWLLFSFCTNANLPNLECHWLFGARNISEYWHGWCGQLKGGFYMAQDLVLLYITLTFIMLSVSFVYRTQLLWKKSPFHNKPWCVCVIVSFILQLIYTVCSLSYWKNERSAAGVSIKHVSPYLYAVCVVWLFALVAINEVLKRKYIRAYVRFQKRERLKFDTKLGMNSPV